MTTRTLDYIVDGFVDNNSEFQISFYTEDDARKEFEKRKVNCVEVNLWCNDTGYLSQIDGFNRPFATHYSMENIK